MFIYRSRHTEKESSTPELFQIANGCNQSVGFQEQGYTAAFPLVFIQRQVEEKVPNTMVLVARCIAHFPVDVPSRDINFNYCNSDLGSHALSQKH